MSNLKHIKLGSTNISQQYFSLQISSDLLNAPLQFLNISLLFVLQSACHVAPHLSKYDLSESTGSSGTPCPLSSQLLTLSSVFFSITHLILLQLSQIIYTSKMSRSPCSILKSSATCPFKTVIHNIRFSFPYSTVFKYLTRTVCKCIVNHVQRKTGLVSG